MAEADKDWEFILPETAPKRLHLRGSLVALEGQDWTTVVYLRGSQGQEGTSLVPKFRTAALVGVLLANRGQETRHLLSQPKSFRRLLVTFGFVLLVLSGVCVCWKK